MQLKARIMDGETLCRTVLDHFVAFGGVPLCAVFDRPKTVAISWKSDGTVTEWNSTFALAATEIGFVPEVCWAYAPTLHRKWRGLTHTCWPAATALPGCVTPAACCIRDRTG